MEEENKTEFNAAPKKKGSKKPFIICLCIILVLAIVAVIVGVVLMKSGKLNFSKKSKLSAGVDQLTESIMKPVDDISNAIENNNLEVKVLNNISKGDAIAIDTEVSASIDNIEVSGMTSSDEKIMDAVKEFLNSASIGLNAQYDGKEKVYANANLSMDGNSISAEGLYDGEKAAFRSKELNEKWLAISKSDLLKQMGVNESDLEEAKKAVEKALEGSTELVNSVKIDQKTADEIEKRYKDVLKDFISSKEKSIKEEKTKVKVDGKEKSCQKLTLTLDEKDLKKLLKNYVSTFQKDTQTQGIIKNYMESLNKYMNDMSTEIGTSSYTSDMENMLEQWNDLLKELDTISSEIDNISFDGKIKLIVYATNTEVYKTEISVEYSGAVIELTTEYTDNKSVTEITVSQGSQEMTMGTLEIESNNGSGRIKFEASSMLAAAAKMEKLVVECSYKISGNSEEVNLNFDMGSKIGSGSISAVSNVNKNEDKAYEGDSRITLDINVANEVKLKGSVKAKVGIRVGSESIPTVANSDTVNMNSASEVEKYANDAQTKAQDLIKKFSSNKALNNLFEATTGESLEEIVKALESQIVSPSTPSTPSIPDLEMPDFEMPDIEMPDLEPAA